MRVRVCVYLVLLSIFVDSQNWEPTHDMGSYGSMGTIMPNLTMYLIKFG